MLSILKAFKKLYIFITFLSTWFKMSWEESRRKDNLRRIVGNIDDYEVFLGHDTEDADLIRRRIPLYEQIAQMGDRIGHRIFVPYHFTKLPGDPDEMSHRDKRDLLEEGMIPHCKLILCDLGANSESVYDFAGKAMSLGKEIIYFFDRGTTLVTIGDGERMALISLPRMREDILKEPRALFNKSVTGTFYRYPSVKELVGFGSIGECVAKLEAAVKRHII